MKVRAAQRQETYIFMITMADVALQLVFILFMVTSILNPQTWSAIELALPQAKKSEQKTWVKEKSITISKKGQYYLNGVPMATEAIEAGLADLLKDATGDARAVMVKADKTCDYQSVVAAIDIVNRLDGMLVLIVEEEGPSGGAGGSVSAAP